MSIKKILERLKQRIIDIYYGKVKDKIIDVDIGKVKDKIIDINHVFSRIFHKIIIIDHEVLAFLTVGLVVIGSLVGFGICTLRQRDKQSESSGELEGMIQELETELRNIRDVLVDRDSEIEALSTSLNALRPGDRPRILSVGMDIPKDNINLAVDIIDFQYSTIAVGVKRVEPESEWYYQDPIVGGNTSTKFDFYWLEGVAGAPEGFLAPDTLYRVAIWYDGGYDEVTVNSLEVGNGVQVGVSEDEGL